MFLVVNLVTQGLLNLWLNGFSPSQDYLVFSLLGSELLVFVFVTEIIAFLVLIDEHSRLRTFAYVVSANSLSLIVGGFVITLLPA